MSHLHYAWVLLLLFTLIAIFIISRDTQTSVSHAPPPEGTVYMAQTRTTTTTTSLLSHTAMLVTDTDDTDGKNSSFRRAVVKQILWYDPPAWLKTWNPAVNFRRCSYSNCVLHEDKQRLQHSAAVVTLVPRCHSPPVPLHSREPDQPWIFFSLESPAHIKKVERCPNDDRHNAYNWSWSYRRDADIVNPSEILQTNPNKNAHIVKNYTAIYRRKTKFAAWVVSHCKTQGRREDYVKLLQRYVNVDVYGGCATNKIEDESYKKFLMNTDYKFYLGFENSLCKDYITEKFFLYNSLDVVVVVRGGADYSSLLPHGTYIDTANFTSVKALANFLIRLGSNEEEYISYLRRKDEFILAGDTYQLGMCQLCEKLNSLDSNRKVYASLDDYIHKDQCRPPRDIVT